MESGSYSSCPLTLLPLGMYGAPSAQSSYRTPESSYSICFRRLPRLPVVRAAGMTTAWNQDPLWTQQIDGLTRRIVKIPAHLALRSQQFGNTQAERCSSSSRYPARPTKCVAGERSPSEGRRHEQELLWRQFFLDPALWWDNRRDKKSSRSPDFRRKGSGEVLWLNNLQKPAWVDEQLAALDMQMGRGSFTSKSSSLPDMPVPGKPAGQEMGPAPVSICTTCQQGKLSEAAVGALAGNGSVREGGSQEQERLWRQFFRDPTLWWDNRQDKKSADFRRKGSGEVLWLNNKYKPAWVDEQLVALDIQMGRGAPTSKSSLREKPDPGKPEGYGTGVTAVSVSTLCQQGKLCEGVAALEVLAKTDCPISKSLFYTVLKQCVAKKDLFLGRRVHALTVKTGYESDTFLSNHILRMYSSHARLQEAMDVFTQVDTPDAFMWSSIISAHIKHGEPKLAIQLYHQMHNSSVKPDGHVFAAALQACARAADLETGQQVHADVLASGVEPDLFVVSGLVDMYAKCGSLKDAQTLFDMLPQKNVVTWTALIAGYSQQCMGQEALRLYSAMQDEGITPNSVTFVCLLQACASLGAMSLEKGKQLHAEIVERRLQADVVVSSSLVNMYAKCGSLQDAQSVFDRIPQKDVVTWNTMIAGYSQQGMGLEALHTYSAMQEENITTPDSMTFVSLLQAFASIGTTALEKGKQLHAQIREQGLEAELIIGNSLVNMYAKCGSVNDAQRVFDRLSEKDVVTWSAMIAGYSQQGMGLEALHLYRAMEEEGISAPDSVTFVYLLQACASVGTTALEKGKHVHAQIEERGLEADVVVGNSLVNMYAKCGSVKDAKSVFDRLPQKNVVTWTAMIAGYSQEGMGQEALHLYSAMQDEGLAAPNSVTFVCLLQACVSVGTMALEKGKQIHAQIEERGLKADVVVGNSLVNMYAKCGSSKDAQSVFDRLPQKNVVTWTAMIAGYSQEGMGQEALHLYSAMQEEGIAAPNSVTFVCLLQACASVGTMALEKGKQIHAQIEERGLEADVAVGNSLVNMYAKCGSLKDAQSVFDRLPDTNVVTWNAMIAGYSQQGMGQEALNLYSVMQEDGITAPDSVTFACLLQACASMAALPVGMQLHAKIEELGLETDGVIGGSLVNMYAKCGSMVDAQRVFDALPERGIVTWNALIAGYTRQGDSELVFDLVQRMREDCRQPDDLTFVSVLTVCSHAGLVHKGREYFDDMSRNYGMTPSVEHYTCMVDLLGRAGQVDEALEVVRTMPVQSNDIIWHALLGACQKWRNVEVGRHAFDEAVKLNEKDAAAYVMMSNIYTGAQMWEEAQEIQARRKKIGAWKQPGESWWTDPSGRAHSFLVGDKKYPESERSSSANEERRVCAGSGLVITRHI